jgi:hypothetical protein
MMPPPSTAAWARPRRAYSRTPGRTGGPVRWAHRTTDTAPAGYRNRRKTDRHPPGTLRTADTSPPDIYTLTRRTRAMHQPVPATCPLARTRSAAAADRAAERPAGRADLADHGPNPRLPGLLVGVDVLLGQARVQQLRVQVAREPVRAAIARLLLHGRLARPGRSGQAERREHFCRVRRRTRQDRDREAVLR